MNRVIYYNITYCCNLNCLYCFSNSTNLNGKVMEKNSIINGLQQTKPNKNDLIVLNGGEPTVHPDFYELLYELQRDFSSEIAVYTNGSILHTAKLWNRDNLFFVIPIHGYEKEHDTITQKIGSFKMTMDNLKHLNENDYRYRIKFIINAEMISGGFNIEQFLKKNKLRPEEVIIARLNSTSKSRTNNVLIPTRENLMLYINTQMKYLKNSFKIKFLDIPPCFLKNDFKLIGNYEIPEFLFNDPNNEMCISSYFKDVFVGSRCDGCVNYKVCEIMKKSYLTLSYDEKGYMLEME